MALFDKALGVHPFAMQLRIDRAEVIASNLANVDTPNFKARDVDYQQILGDVAASMEHNNDVGFAGITANELMYLVSRILRTISEKKRSILIYSLCM